MKTLPEFMHHDALRTTAAQLHASIGQLYGDEPYEVHLDEVANVLVEHGYTRVSHPSLHEAVYGHDLKEDVKLTDQQLLDYGFSPEAIILIEKVTDEEGANRKERKSKTYAKTASNSDAIILKLADRIANVSRGSKNDMYRKEQPAFSKALRPHSVDCDAMWARLDAILDYHPSVEEFDSPQI